MVHAGRVRAMLVAVRMVVVVRMPMFRMVVVMMMGRMAVRSATVAVVVDVFFRLAGGAKLRLARRDLFEDHFGLTASANAAHQAISTLSTFRSPRPTAAFDAFMLLRVFFVLFVVKKSPLRTRRGTKSCRAQLDHA